MTDRADSRPPPDPAGESEQRFQTLVDALPDAIFVHCHDRIVFANPFCARLLGAERPDQLLGRDIYDFIHPDSRAVIRRRIHDCYETGAANPPRENVNVCLDGSLISTEATSMRIAWNGSPAIVVVLRDIGKRKKVEETLRQYERVVEGLEDMIVVVNREFRYVIANRALLSHRNMEREQVLGRFVSEVMDLPVFEAVVKGKLEECFKGNVVRFDMKYNYPDLGERELSISYYPIESAGAVTAAACVLRDVTERRQMEHALRKSEEKYRELFENATYGVLRTALDGTILDVNPAMATMLGYASKEDLMSLNMGRDIYQDPAERPSIVEKCALGCADGLEANWKRRDGKVISVRMSGRMIRGNAGTGNMEVIVEDITQRRNLEQQLRQAQKMEAVGRFAGGIAHDFNNLLMVIRIYTEMLRDSLPPHDPLRRNTHETLKAVDHAASLTRQMLAFSRKQILSPVVLDLNAVIADAVKMLRRVIGEDIEVRVYPDQLLGAVEADPDQIVQVLMNLSVNARDAMPQGGTLTITTGNAKVEEGGLGGRPYVSPGDYVRLSVTDTGSGMSSEIQEQIFDPFFSTKEPGKGTGLGLSSVFGIVKQSGGYVWVESEPGQGASFTIYLPKVKAIVSLNASPRAEAQPGGTETVLVVEDESALREAICSFLRSLGYTVLAADSGLHALSVASDHEGQIDLLVTDVVMPKMSGTELAQILGNLRAGLKIIYMSGYPDDEVFQHGLHELGAAFLQKPFSLRALARKVRDALGRVERN